MKRFFATILALLLLLSLAACGESDSGEDAGKKKKVTIYVVTEQKIYVNGELSSTATFQYDDRGRPTEVGFLKADGSGRKSQLSYDKKGNRVGDIHTQSFASGEQYEQKVDWNLTYTHGLLTQAEMPRGEDAPYVLKFQYDEEKQLTLVEYPQPELGVSGYLWQSYAYDEAGRLTRETRCTFYPDGYGSELPTYTYSQVRYFYDEQGRLTEQCFCSAQTTTDTAPEALDTLDFQVSPYEHYFFYYDEAGKLAYIGNGEEDTYPGGSAEIYSDERYTFDENGNLVRVEQSKKLGQDQPSWTEYTYKAIEASKSDAVMHRRLIHGISNFTLSYTVYNTMDPLFWAMCPAALYSYHLCSMPFYYLIPYPQFELLA